LSLRKPTATWVSVLEHILHPIEEFWGNQRWMRSGEQLTFPSELSTIKRIPEQMPEVLTARGHLPSVHPGEQFIESDSASRHPFEGFSDHWSDCRIQFNLTAAKMIRISAAIAERLQVRPSALAHLLR